MRAEAIPVTGFVALSRAAGSLGHKHVQAAL
jgi:hypothetical protein